MLAVVGNLISCSMAAYAFARLKFRLKWLWFALMLGTIMLPIHVQLIPQYIFFLNIGWVNTILPLVVPKFLAHGRLLHLPDGAVHALAAARARAGGDRRRRVATGSATGASSCRCRCRRW